jgi:hypothetical protein
MSVTEFVKEFVQIDASFWHKNPQADAARGEYQSIEELLLAQGRLYMGAKKRIPGCGWTMGRQKFCYRNSWRLLEKDPKRFRYCEGLYSGGFEHAWIEDGDDGLVIDRTLREPAAEYFGLRIEPQIVWESIAMCGHDSVLGNFQMTKRLLSDPEFRAKAIV